MKVKKYLFYGENREKEMGDPSQLGGGPVPMATNCITYLPEWWRAQFCSPQREKSTFAGQTGAVGFHLIEWHAAKRPFVVTPTGNKKRRRRERKGFFLLTLLLSRAGAHWYTKFGLEEVAAAAALSDFSPLSRRKNNRWATGETITTSTTGQVFLASSDRQRFPSSGHKIYCTTQRYRPKNGYVLRRGRRNLLLAGRQWVNQFCPPALTALGSLQRLGKNLLTEKLFCFF